MSVIHCSNRRPFNPPAGQCRWVWHWEDVTLWCSDTAIPGGIECADHLIWRCQRADFQPALPERGPQPRRFPPTVVNLEDTK